MFKNTDHNTKFFVEKFSSPQRNIKNLFAGLKSLVNFLVFKDFKKPKMKLAAHTEHIRTLIDKAFRNQLGRLGFTKKQVTAIPNLLDTQEATRQRIQNLLSVFTKELGQHSEGFEKLVEELTFTLFNRLAALKVMEAHVLHPEIVTRRTEHGDRAFAHLAWLEEHPDGRNQEAEGLLPFFKDKLVELSDDIPLFSLKHPYHLLPTAIELKQIIEAFNAVEQDKDVADDIWKSDDILGWLYESYNNYKKDAHKASKAKTEYNKVSIQSQVYTPRWVVQFLVDNSLGKLYLEMYPDSEIKYKYKIANAPNTQCRTPKPLHEVRLIDPATGSGNFLLYAFDLFYELYLDQIEEYDADYNERDIPKLIIENNLHGVDLDDRAIQLAQLGLYIKAKRKRATTKIAHFNIVSADFFLPAYREVKAIFENNDLVGDRERKIIEELWDDLQNAHKFGSLVRLEEKMSLRWFGTKQKVADNVITLFDNENIEDYETFKTNFFTNLQTAITEYTTDKGQNFLNTKTKDAITFLKLLTQQYDVATANPPYTSSSDFGKKLKTFINNNYKKPHGFHTNLYATFIKRCYELLDNKGRMALVHPPTFMYIKTFVDVREFMITKTSIDLFVEWGYLGMFNPTARVDAAMYVLEKDIKETKTQFIKLNDIYEGRRYEGFVKAYDDLLNNQPNKHNIQLDQEKLKIIDGMPFIYWISDGFREKFEGESMKDFAKSGIGLSTSDNEKYIRYWWEIEYSYIGKNWKIIAKGGKFNKWYGNLWLCSQWTEGRFAIAKNPKATLRNQSYYFKKGYFFNRASTKGISCKILPSGCLIESSIVTVYTEEYLLYYILGISNTLLFQYIADCLNATVSFQAGDNDKVPVIVSNDEKRLTIEDLVKANIEKKKQVYKHSLIETNYEQSPLLAFSGSTLKDRVHAFLDDENAALTEVLLNEAIINELVFEVYELSPADREQVETKMGKSIGAMPVQQEALAAYQAYIEGKECPTKALVLEHLQALDIAELDGAKTQAIQEGLPTLYQSNNDLEEFCITHQVNPINVWYLFRNSCILPKARMADIALEFLADAIRTLLTEDDDGIIPLVSLPGEPRLSDRLEQFCIDSLGFTSAQYMQLEELLARPLNDYLEQYFFSDLSDHLNLFMYLPKTPFIWHLSSGKYQGIEVFALIYKWNRDSLYKLKSQYISHRKERLEYRQIELQGIETAQAQNEKELIRYQLDEIQEFEAKIDALIATDYNPKLDDGVGKNIAPLQEKGLLKTEVLKKKQLEKYLNADW